MKAPLIHLFSLIILFIYLPEKIQATSSFLANNCIEKTTDEFRLKESNTLFESNASAIECNDPVECLYSGITFSSQAQIDVFKADYSCCNKILGSITISGADITNLDSLESIEFINGSLVIIDNPNLIDLAGLENLKRIEGLLKIQNNGVLQSTSPGLDNLEFIGYNLEIINNPQLEQVDLYDVGAVNIQNVFVNNNPNLQGLSMPNHIPSATNVQIIDNPQLTFLNGFENLQSIAGGMVLRNTGVQQFLFPLLNTVGYNILIEENQSLLNASFPNVGGVINHIYIQNNSSLESIDMPDQLTAIEGSFIMSGNTSLLNFNGFGNLASIGGGVRIVGNMLGSLQNFSNLSHIGYNLIIQNNPGLTNINFYNVSNTEINEIHITNNENLAEVQLPNGIQTIQTNLLIDFNPIQTLTGLGALSSVVGTIRINNTLAPTFPSFAGLNSIGYAITLLSNTGVTALDFSGVNTSNIYQISVSGNDNLQSLNLPTGVQNIQNNLEIYANPELELLTGLDALESVNALFRIDNTNISDFPTLNNIQHLQKIRLVDNSLLPNLLWLDALASVGDNLTMFNNPNLNYCSVDAVVDYLLNTNNPRSINQNKDCCYDEATILSSYNGGDVCDGEDNNCNGEIDEDGLCCTPDAGQIMNTSDIPNNLSMERGNDLLSSTGDDVLFTSSSATLPDYQYAFVLVNRLNTIKKISLASDMDFGNFDFSVLPPGDYSIYGLSYKSDNIPSSLIDFLNTQIINQGSLDDIADINNIEGICLDISNVPANGATTSITITPAPNDYYWVNGAGNWTDYQNHWAACSGCDPSDYPVSGVPGIINNVYFDEFSGFLLNDEVSVDQSFTEVNSLDWTGVQNDPKLVGSGSMYIYGSVILAPGMSWSYTGNVRFRSDNSGNIISMFGQSFRNVFFENSNGEWIFTNYFRARNVYHMQGHVNTNDQSVYIYDRWQSNQNGSRSLSLGSSTLNINYLIFSSSNNFSFDAGTSTITLRRNVIDHFGGNKNFYNISTPSSNYPMYLREFNVLNKATFNSSNTFVNYRPNANPQNYSSYFNEIEGNGNVYFNNLNGTLNKAVFNSYALLRGVGFNEFGDIVFKNNGQIQGNNIFEQLTFSPGYSYFLQAGKTQTIATNGNIHARGLGSGRILINSTSLGSQATIKKDGAMICLDYVSLRDIRAEGTAKFYAGEEPFSENIGGNSSDLLFEVCPDCDVLPYNIQVVLDDASIVNSCDVPDRFYELILENLGPDDEAVWFDEHYNEIYSSSDNLYAFQSNTQATYYGAIRNTLSGCVSQSLIVEVGCDSDCDGVFDEGFDQDLDGLYDCYDNCPTTYNPDQSDEDCDGVGDVCDVCPGADDGVDGDGDGVADCLVPPSDYMDIIEDWKCAPGKIEVCTGGNNPQSKCVNFNAAANFINNGGYIGPCLDINQPGTPCNLNGILLITGNYTEEAVELRWTPEVNIEDSFYEIQKSLTGANWEVIGFATEDDKDGQNEYLYIDDAYDFNRAFYRVKQIIPNEEVLLSNQVLISNTNFEFDFKVFPNPSEEVVNLQINNPSKGRMLIKISDQFGRIIWQSELIKDAPVYYKQFNLNKNGIYFLNINVRDKVYNEKILIIDEG